MPATVVRCSQGTVEAGEELLGLHRRADGPVGGQHAPPAARSSPSSRSAASLRIRWRICSGVVGQTGARARRSRSPRRRPAPRGPAVRATRRGADPGRSPENIRSVTSTVVRPGRLAMRRGVEVAVGRRHRRGGGQAEVRHLAPRPLPRRCGRRSVTSGPRPRRRRRRTAAQDLVAGQGAAGRSPARRRHPAAAPSSDLGALGRRPTVAVGARRHRRASPAGSPPLPPLAGRAAQVAGRVAVGEPGDRVGHGRVDQPGERAGAGGAARSRPAPAGPHRGRGRSRHSRTPPEPSVGAVLDRVPHGHHQGGVERGAVAREPAGGRCGPCRRRPGRGRPSVAPRACTPSQ